MFEATILSFLCRERETEKHTEERAEHRKTDTHRKTQRETEIGEKWQCFSLEASGRALNRKL